VTIETDLKRKGLVFCFFYEPGISTRNCGV